MKKNNILLLAILFFTVATKAQNALEIIAKETCSCAQTKKIDFTQTDVAKVQTELGFCMLESYTNHKNELSPEDQIDIGSSTEMQRIGEKIGIKMMNYCPDIIIALGKASSQEKEVVTTNSEIEGTFIEQIQNEFITIKIKDNQGRIHNLLYLTQFNNADKLTDKSIKKNTPITVAYTEYEFFDPKSKDYKFFKVITDLKLKP